MSARYSGMGAAAAFSKRAAALGIPASVTFQITDRCNYRCAHCYEVHDDRDELGTDEIARILGEVADAGTMFLTLTGGEVYMRRDVDAILAEARRLRFAVRLYTTGHFIDEARAAQIRDLAIKEVHLSLYGPDAASHEAVTRMPGSFERTVGAARRLRARGVFVVLKSPVMTVNVRRHEELRELIEKLGCRYVMDAKLTSREDGERSPLHLRPSVEDLTDFYSSYAPELSENTARIARSGGAGSARGTSRPCSIGRSACTINPQGLVFACSSLPVPVGDLRRQSFLDVWRGSSKLSELRSLTWDDIAVCRDCELRAYCNRCHAMALLEDGNLTGPSREACRQAVALRESLRQRGLIAADTPDTLPVPLRADAALPRRVDEKLAYGFRPAALRILP